MGAFAQYWPGARRPATCLARGGFGRTALLDAARTCCRNSSQTSSPRWTERVTGAMADAPTKADRILAYALAHVDLVAEGAHAVGFALATLAPGLALDSRWT
ncbi:hypothetical protein [Specibacter sp. NPDC078692]|uniref:hypothetical protein n=1 Tax=Specibacter sp. NPDC078692 TaxID=3155818 RepID=UPI00341A7850